MTVLAEKPPLALSDAEIEAFRRDGAICVRGLYEPKWVELLTEGLEEICAAPSPMGFVSLPGLVADAYTWLVFDRIRDFVLFGPSAHIFQQAFGARKVNFFYDQIFVKLEMTNQTTAWHEDSTFWPMKGEQIASLWTSVDPVTPQTSALEFVAGSHLWKKNFKAVGLDGTVLPDTRSLEDVPDIEGNRDKFNILSWDLEPGDALLFHARILHGSRGNPSATRKRRAITTRWCGDNVVYRDIKGPVPIAWAHGLKDGDPPSGFMFPQVLPEMDMAAIAQRMARPIFPDLDAIRKAKATMFDELQS